MTSTTLSTYHDLEDGIYIYGADRQSSRGWSASHAHMIAENAINIAIEKVEETGSSVYLETYCGHDSVLVSSDDPHDVWNKVVPAEDVQERYISHSEPHYTFGGNPCGDCVNIFDNAKRFINDEKFS